MTEYQRRMRVIPGMLIAIATNGIGPLDESQQAYCSGYKQALDDLVEAMEAALDAEPGRMTRIDDSSKEMWRMDWVERKLTKGFQEIKFRCLTEKQVEYICAGMPEIQRKWFVRLLF